MLHLQQNLDGKAYLLLFDKFFRHWLFCDFTKAFAADFARVANDDKCVRIDLVDEVVDFINLLPAHRAQKNLALHAAVAAARFERSHTALHFIEYAVCDFLTFGGNNKHHFSGANAGAI